MALRDCTESVSARHAEAVAAAIGQRAGGVRPGFHGDGRGTQFRPECASSSPPSAGTVSRGVHPENLLRIVQQGNCGAVREIRKLGARNGVPGEANAAGRNERRRNA